MYTNLVLVTAIASLGWGQGATGPMPLPGVLPQSQPPQLVWARMAGKELEILQKVTVCETAQRSITMRGPDGKEYAETQTYVVCKQVPQLKKMLVEKTKFATAAGPVDAAQVRTLLQEPTPVLVAQGAGTADPRYLSAFKKGMLLLTFQGHSYGMPVEDGVPAPAPKFAPSAQSVLSANEYVALQTEEIQSDIQSYLKAYAGATGPFPEVRLVKMDEKGNLNLWTINENSFSRTAYREIDVNGSKQKVPYSLNSTTYQVQGTQLPSRSFKAVSAQGKSIGELELGWLLSKDRMVLVCFDGQTPAPWVLKLAGSDTPVISVSASAMDCGGCGGGYAAPVPVVMPAPPATIPVPRLVPAAPKAPAPEA